MFDPFNDFEDKGYLRNRFAEKDLDIIREMEHTMFRAGLDEALDYISARTPVTYTDFLKVHYILFNEFYPWAGKDRSLIAPNCAVSKAGTLFCHPKVAQRAVETGLTIASNTRKMKKRAGEILGYFAYGHPFLDGNGRTMLIIHSELCYRAGFSINWQNTQKNTYLNALSKEIEAPGQRHLDMYLKPFIEPRLEREYWSSSIDKIKGLDGRSNKNKVDGEYSDATIKQQYEKFERRRSDSISDPD